MTPTLKLGRIAGVAVGVHWSVLAIVVLVVAGLSTHFSGIAPGYPWVAYLLAAVVAAVLFVLSLLAHEMAHAIVAQRNGVEVEGITLWLLGGVARLRGEARTPGADFRISVIGPVASLLAAAVFGAAAWLAELADMNTLIVAVPRYLAAINVVLAAFNTIPAAPLDGGRILRAVVWAWRRDRLSATVVAARAGRFFGFTLIALGLLQAMGGLGGGVWWILLGLFVVTMASAEERHARISTALGGVRVRDIMTANPETAHADATVSEFLRDFALLRRHSAFPLVDHFGRLQGLVTLNRIRAVPPEQRASTLLRDVACPADEVPQASPDELLSALLPRLKGCADGRAVVVDHGVMVGIVSPSDISRAAALHGLGVQFGAGGADISETTSR
ncbi:site-2 protease family protein [Mycobacterium shimoidei]|uniref:site-2 protease family protein n=1 Tax=Mycobacterium shimoidei TaxID=29313 RepID=UPI000848B8AE|nr:site-2 protease family protein [Mycobacterium shimoidei]MCV7258260.1 site-2 protease family protein [Mycobacterium shimoidei]ODR12945.1 peptidase M50 [Mycobacterium shimoidei]ORW82093.1 peptidase M50 [Mycobacterium shimoidei]